MRRLSTARFLVMALLGALALGAWGCGGGGGGGGAGETATIAGTVTRGAAKALGDVAAVPNTVNLTVAAVDESGNIAASQDLGTTGTSFSLIVPVGHDYVIQFRQGAAVLAVLEVQPNRLAFSVKAGAGTIALGAVDVDLANGRARHGASGDDIAKMPAPASTSTIFRDANNDGIMDVAALADSSGDGIPDGLAISLGLNPSVADSQATTRDTDGDGIRDVDEAKLGTQPKNKDSDGDGLDDGVENADKDAVVDAGETDPRKFDTDGDGMSDGFEVAGGLNALNAGDGTGDADSDGLNNLREFQLGTNPRNSDSDGDGLADGREVTVGTDPAKFDSDGDGVADGSDSFPLDALQFAAFQAPRLLDPLPTGVGVASKFSSANAVNGSDLIVGASEALLGGAIRVQAAFWDGAQPTGTLVAGLLPGIDGPANTYAAAMGVNKDGFVVGESDDPGVGIQAVIWKLTKTPGGNQYQVTSGPTVLAPLPGDVSASAYAINDAGRVVGESRNAAGLARAVYWDAVVGGQIQLQAPVHELPHVAGLMSAAYSINADSSNIVGEAADSAGSIHAAAWEFRPETGAYVFVDLGSAQHARSAAYGAAVTGNGKRLIVGEATQVAGGARVAQMWDITLTSTFQFPVLGTPTTQSNALAVNALGAIAGWQTDISSVWNAGLSNPATTAPVVPATTSAFSQAYSLNDKGTVVGMLRGAGGDQAFMAKQTLP